MSEEVGVQEEGGSPWAPAWKAKSPAGRKPVFATPDDLLSACMAYLDWTHANPLMAAEAVKYQGVASIVMVPKMRAPTLVGLCGYLDISRQTWSNYREREGFLDTCTRVEDAIYQAKVEGAAADLLNAGFIGREVGLADKRELEHSGEVKSGVVTVQLVPTDTDDDR